jgi:hypothetical protein
MEIIPGLTSTTRSVNLFIRLKNVAIHRHGKCQWIWMNLLPEFILLRSVHGIPMSPTNGLLFRN